MKWKSWAALAALVVFGAVVAFQSLYKGGAIRPEQFLPIAKVTPSWTNNTLPGSQVQIPNFDPLAWTSFDHALYVDDRKAYARLTVHNLAPFAWRIDPMPMRLPDDAEFFYSDVPDELDWDDQDATLRNENWYRQQVVAANNNRQRLVMVPPYGAASFLVTVGSSQIATKCINLNKKVTVMVGPRVVVMDAGTGQYATNIYASDKFTITDIKRLPSR